MELGLMILMWIGIIIGGCIALYLLIYVAMILFALFIMGGAFILGLFGVVLETRKDRKDRKFRKVRNIRFKL